MNEHIQKIRKLRQFVKEIDGKKFLLRRPTDLEYVEKIHKQGILEGHLVQWFVIGWFGITEADLYPGGTGEEVAFDRELFAEWIVDKPNLWGALSEAIINAYIDHAKNIDDTKKKPGSISNPDSTPALPQAQT